MENLIIILILIVIIGGAILYIIKEKKKGVKCIGCPMAGQCAKSKSGGCSSGTSDSGRTDM